MDDPALSAEARRRQERARGRADRTAAHERDAIEQAERTPDPSMAEIHRRAARVNREAVEIQAQHAEEHEP